MSFNKFEQKVLEFNNRNKFMYSYNLIDTVQDIMEQNYGVKRQEYPYRDERMMPDKETWDKWFIYLDRHNYIYDNLYDYLKDYLDNNKYFPDIKHVIKQVGKYYLLYNVS